MEEDIYYLHLRMGSQTQIQGFTQGDARYLKDKFYKQENFLDRAENRIHEDGGAVFKLFYNIRSEY